MLSSFIHIGFEKKITVGVIYLFRLSDFKSIILIIDCISSIPQNEKESKTIETFKSIIIDNTVSNLHCNNFQLLQ